MEKVFFYFSRRSYEHFRAAFRSALKELPSSYRDFYDSSFHFTCGPDSLFRVCVLVSEGDSLRYSRGFLMLKKALFEMCFFCVSGDFCFKSFCITD